MSGPAPTPTEVLKLRGSWRSNRPGEPQPKKGEPDRPDWLSPEAQAAWGQIVPVLMQMGVLTKADGNALARYCELWVEWRQCCQHTLEHGLTFPLKNKDGDVISQQVSPEATQRNKLSVELRRLEDAFGLTPAARARIKVEPEEAPAPVRKRTRRA